MKIYQYKLAPNPRRVRVFLAEKGISVPFQEVDIFKGENRTPEFLKKNPMGGLPVLEFDDGTCLPESVAICRYFEGIHPEPRLMGTDLRDQVFVEMWNRRMELEIFGPLGRFLQNTSEIFKGRFQQFPDYGQVQRANALKRYEWLDGELKQRTFIAGERYTIADITALVAMDFAKNLGGVQIPTELKNLNRWHQSVSSRPSAQA